MGELYRTNDFVELSDLVDTLVTDYHGPFAEGMLAMMTGAAVRNGMLAGAEAGMVTVTVPADAEIDPDIAPMVDGSGGILGDPVWAVAPVPAPASNSRRSASISCGGTCWRKERTRLCWSRYRDAEPR